MRFPSEPMAAEWPVKPISVGCSVRKAADATSALLKWLQEATPTASWTMQTCVPALLADFADRPGRPLKNRFFAKGDGKFVDGDGTFSGFTLVETHGCSGRQIIQVVGIGDGHDKVGITRGVILDWIAAHQ